MKSKIVPFTKKYTMVIALVIVFILFTGLTGGRLVLAQNLSNLLLQNGYVLVLACGMLLCILTGGNVDLSIGSTVCLVGAVAAQLLANTGLPAIVIILICLVVGLLIGIYQGFLIGYVHIPPFICTLSGMFLFRGIARVILQSKTVSISQSEGTTGASFLKIFTSYIQFPGEQNGACTSALIIGIIIAVIILGWFFYSRVSRAKKGYRVPPFAPGFIKMLVLAALVVIYFFKLSQYKGIPVMAIWVIAVIAIYAFITSKTATGRYFYAVGGNEKATKLSGINTKKVYFLAYASMSLLAGLAGLLMAARIGSVDGNTGTSFEMDAIGSCFIGGASAYGGSGTVPGIMIGAILLGVINQGMSIMGLDNNWQYIVKGAVLLIAVIFDVVSNKKTGKS